MLNLYQIILVETGMETQTGIIVAESHHQAEEKGKEWAKKWELKGFKYHGTFFISSISLSDMGEVISLFIN